MKPHITKHLAWLAMALTLSSCSCCRIDIPPLTTAQDKIFSKYKTGDTVSLKSDSGDIKIICKKITTNSERLKGGGTTPCLAKSTKLFDFQFISSRSKIYKNTTVQRTLVVQRTIQGGGDETMQFGTVSPETIYSSLQISNTFLQNVRGLNFTELTLEEFPEVFYDSTGFVLAANSSRTIIYK